MQTKAMRTRWAVRLIVPSATLPEDPTVTPTMATRYSQMHMTTAPASSMFLRPARSIMRIPGTVQTTLTTLVWMRSARGRSAQVSAWRDARRKSDKEEKHVR
jgi:hypothetical protein